MDIKDITIQLEDIAKSERMLEGTDRPVAGWCQRLVLSRGRCVVPRHPSSPTLADLVKTRQRASGIQLSDADRAEYMQKCVATRHRRRAARTATVSNRCFDLRPLACAVLRKEVVSSRTADDRQRLEELKRVQKAEGSAEPPFHWLRRRQPC